MSPRTREQNEQIREDRRSQVLRAAVTLFARDGFDSVSTASIAKAAGVSHGTVFFYYKTKEELYRAAVLEPLGPTHGLVKALLTGPESPLGRIESLARLTLSSYAKEEAYLTLVHQAMRLKDRFKSLHDELVAFSEANKALLADVIAEGQESGEFLSGDPARMATLFFAFLNGCGMMHPAEAGDRIWDDAVPIALRLILRP